MDGFYKNFLNTLDNEKFFAYNFSPQRDEPA